MSTITMTARQCRKRRDAAYLQAKMERHYGQEHYELVRACAREWTRRAVWADKHGGWWNSADYENEKDQP